MKWIVSSDQPSGPYVAWLWFTKDCLIVCAVCDTGWSNKSISTPIPPFSLSVAALKKKLYPQVENYESVISWGSEFLGLKNEIPADTREKGLEFLKKYGQTNPVTFGQTVGMSYQIEAADSSEMIAVSSASSSALAM